MNRRPPMWPFILCWLALPGADGLAAERYRLDPWLPYQAERSSPVTYDVDFSVAITAGYKTRRLQVWLPLAQTDFAQQVEEGKITTFPVEVEPRVQTEPIYGNKFAYFEFDEPQGAQIIRHRFRITLWELRWQLDPADVRAVDEWPAGFEPYLRSDASVAVDDDFRTLVREIISKSREPHPLAGVMAWVNDHMRYDHSAASLRASSRHALEVGRGHCSDYHGLCAALGRALGYPTRITYGIHAFPKNSPSHCKLEAFLPPYGWISFDVSETEKLIEAIQGDAELDEPRKLELVAAARQRLFAGFRDNTWYLQTKGTDYELAPPASQRVGVVRTIYAEADGVPLADPDPDNPDAREFAWMTAHRHTPDRKAIYPFRDWRTLLDEDDKRESAKTGTQEKP